MFAEGKSGFDILDYIFQMDEEGGLQALEGADGPPIQYRVGLDMDEKLNQVLLK